MISYLKGTVVIKREDSLVLLAGGVGYKVFAAGQTLSSLQEGQEAELFCAARIRGEAMELYGVSSLQALQVFEVLNKISGVGPKAALALSSYESVAKLKEALASGDVHLKGIGAKKLAKIMLELQGKLEPFSALGRQNDEALAGLVSLGFSRKAAAEALSQVDHGVADTEKRIREALQILGHS